MVLVKYKKNILVKAFQLEAKRSELAKKNNLLELRKLYLNKLEEIPNQNFSKFWDSLNDRNQTSNIDNPIAWDRLNYVVKNINIDQADVIDIGFGAGDLESILSQKKTIHHLQGVDISNKSVLRAKLKFPQWNFNVGTMDSLKYANESFDYVVALEVLEHIPPSKTLASLREVYRVIKPKGMLIASVPINEGLKDLLDKGMNPNAHVRVYTQSLIHAELKMSDFVVIKTKHLYAFSSYYRLKSMLMGLIPRLKAPNNLIILAQKA